MNRCRCLFFAFCAGAALCMVCLLHVSCSKKITEVHLHDEHKFSYDVIKNYSKALKTPLPVVLLDYHHDAGSPSSAGLSSNWLGKLIVEGYVSSVYWISGYELTKPNRESRMNWLQRYTDTYAPQDAETLLGAYKLIDFTELTQLSLPPHTVISVDLDVLTVDYGSSPELFLHEIAAWITAQQTELITASLSAAYQKTAEAGWAYMTDFVRALQSCKTKRYAFFLESGGASPVPEGNEAARARSRWIHNPKIFRRYDTGFYPGDSQWIFAPALLRALLAYSIQGGTIEAADIISSWQDTNRAALEALFPQDRFRSLAGSVRTAAFSVFSATPSCAAPEQSLHENLGIAVRFIGSGMDRGCLALYTGVPFDALEQAAAYCTVQAMNDPRYEPVTAEEADTLEIEISIFSEWVPMSSPRDFRLGTDSVIMQDGQNKTLLQSALARDRQYAKEAFLSSLSRKAGLAADAWQTGSYSFFKSVSIVYRAPFVQK